MQLVQFKYCHVHSNLQRQSVPPPRQVEQDRGRSLTLLSKAPSLATANDNLETYALAATTMQLSNDFKLATPRFIGICSRRVLRHLKQPRCRSAFLSLCDLQRQLSLYWCCYILTKRNELHQNHRPIGASL